MQTVIDQIWPLFQVVLVDLVLAGDNAIVVALAAAGVPAAARQRVIVVGIAGAAITRILFALITVKLLHFPGLLLVGGTDDVRGNSNRATAAETTVDCLCWACDNTLRCNNHDLE
jgi:hypothetical protein